MGNKFLPVPTFLFPFPSCVTPLLSHEKAPKCLTEFLPFVGNIYPLKSFFSFFVSGLTRLCVFPSVPLDIFHLIDAL